MLQERVDHFEKLLGDSRKKEELHVEQARLLEQQGEHHYSLQVRMDYMEKRLGNWAGMHSEVITLEDRLRYIHELVAELSLKNTGGLRILQMVHKDQEWMKREMAEIGGKVDLILEASECSNNSSGEDRPAVEACVREEPMGVTATAAMAPTTMVCFYCWEPFLGFDWGDHPRCQDCEIAINGWGDD